MYRSIKCIFIGYSSNYRGYRCLDPSTKKVHISRHVVFDEDTFPAKDWMSSPLPPPATASATRGNVSPTTTQLLLPSSLDFTPAPDPSALQPPSTPSATPASSRHTNPAATPEPEFPSAEPQQPHSSALESSDSSCPPQPDSPHDDFPSSSISSPPESPQPATPLPSHPMTTRSKDGITQPKHFSGFKLYSSTKHPLMALHSITTQPLPTPPSRFSQALKSPHWFQAMSEEFSALINNQTWELCPRPLHKNIISNKWVFRVKQKADGTLDRFKARLVAKGFQQQDGIDFTETFSPVVKSPTIRAILAIATHFDWPIQQLDVSNAFLHGSLEEEVFMEQPPGFINQRFPNHVCLLKKALYGLKQAPRAWFNKLSSTLLHLGFSASQVDHSLFVFHTSHICLFLLIYVDDIIITGNNITAISTLIQNLKLEFAMKDLGPLHFFLGIHVTRSTSGLHLSQAKYIAELLEKTKMVGAKPAKSPLPSGTKLSQHDGDPLENVTEYRQIVGALQYCTLTRPDIAFSVNQLCQFMHSPTTVHWSAAKRVLRYLKGSLNHGLFFGKGSLQLNAYSDSDWAGDPDDRRSTTGYAIFLGPCLISWSAKKQPVVSKSSTEAEYRSMAFATAELYWLRMLFRELHLSLIIPPTLWCDNLGALSLASNPVYHARTKHIEVDYHFTREKVVRKDITTRYISTVDQVADIFTKGLTTPRFLQLRDKLHVCPTPIGLRGNVKIQSAVTLAQDCADHIRQASSAEQGTTLTSWKSADHSPDFKEVSRPLDSRSKTSIPGDMQASLL